MTKTKKVYFHYDISDFLDYTINRKDGKKAESMQDMSDMIWNATINGETPGTYDVEYKLTQAKTYLSKQLKNTLKNQEKIKLDDYDQEIQSEIITASSRAWELSYQDEWIEECYDLLYEAIIKSAVDSTGEKYPTVEILTKNKKWKILPNKITPDVWEAKTVRFHTTAERVNFLNDLTIQIDNVQDLADELTAYKSGDLEPFKITTNQYDGIDYYGTLGNDDKWMEYFTDEENITAQIKADIQEEQAKHNNADYLLAQISSHTAQIRQILAEYSTDKEYSAQILRAVGSIEATAKRATLK